LGGGFHKTGNVWNSYLSKWNGTSWDSLPENVNGIVYGLETINNSLYVFGNFDSVGTIAADRIAIWDGIIWSVLPPLPASGQVTEIIEYQGEIYVGGNMEAQNGNNMTSIAKFNGTNWEAVGTGFVGGLANVIDFEIYNGELYIAGEWTAGVGGNVGNNIARWDGTTMRDVGGGSSGVTSAIWDLEVHNGKLYAGGYFTSMDSISALRLAVWNGSQWCATNDDFYSIVREIAFYQDTMYIGSGNNVINGDTVADLIKWVGGTFGDTCGAVVGINNPVPETQHSVLIYPNPNNGIFTLVIDGIGKDETQINVLDVAGKLVLNNTVITSNTETRVPIDAMNLAKGVYVIQVKNNTFNSNIKFIKQ